MSSFWWLQMISALMLTMLPRVMSYGMGFVSCEDDARCGPDEFCYVSGLCVPCLDCASYHRHTPDFIQCIKDAKQCGSCFEGWKDDIFTNGDRRDSCVTTRVLYKQTPPEPYTADPVIRFAQLGEFVLVAITASVFLIGGFLWCRANWAKTSRVLPIHTARPSHCQTTHNLLSRDLPRVNRIVPNNNLPEQTRQPATTTHFWDLPEGLSDQLVENVDTPSTSRSSTLGAGNRVVHMNLGASSGVVQTTIFTAEGYKEATQEAVPFRRPCYEGSEGEEEDELQEQHSPPASPDLSYLHDQDTMPSSWTPANESSSSDDSAHSPAPATAPGSSNETSNDSDAPQPKRLRVSNSESDSGIDVFHPVSTDQGSAEDIGINLYITNNVIIRKG